MKIGLEFEFPLVRQDGSAATYDDNIKLWEEWKKLGYTIKKDPYTQKIIGGYKKTPEGILEVGTDYPTCTFEVGLPPEKNLIAANKAWEKFLRKECLPTLDKYNLKLLGYGTQPVTRHLKKYMSPKGHYAIWNKLLPVKYNHWIRDKAIGFAGSQYNIDVPVEKIAEVSNTITKLTCIVWGLSANDPISNSEITPFFSTRIMLYDRIARGHFFGRRTNFFTSDIKNLEDYITRAWKGRIFEIIRNGQPHYPAKSAFSTWDFIKANKATFIDLDGNKKVLTNEGKNVFIEVRSVSTCPQRDILSWPAFFLGIIANHEQVKELVKDWDMKELYKFIDVIHEKGASSHWKGKTMYQWGGELVKIAREGLKGDKKMLALLGPIENIVKKGKCPADETLAVYKKGGMKKLINHLALK